MHISQLFTEGGSCLLLPLEILFFFFFLEVSIVWGFVVGFSFFPIKSHYSGAHCNHVACLVEIKS